MNKTKYINKILRNKFIRKAVFKRVVLENIDKNINIIAFKIRESKDIDEYVRPLNDYHEQFFLIYPRDRFSTKNFNKPVDLVFLNSKYNVVEIVNNAEPNSNFNFNGKYYLILIMGSGLARYLKIEPNMKLRLKKYLYNWYKD